MNIKNVPYPAFSGIGMGCTYHTGFKPDNLADLLCLHHSSHFHWTKVWKVVTEKTHSIVIADILFYHSKFQCGHSLSTQMILPPSCNSVYCILHHSFCYKIAIPAKITQQNLPGHSRSYVKQLFILQISHTVCTIPNKEVRTRSLQQPDIIRITICRFIHCYIHLIFCHGIGPSVSIQHTCMYGDEWGFFVVAI